MAIVGILSEVAGALAMLLGCCTRLAGLLLLGQMTVAVALVHWQAGFLAPKGYEYPLTLGGVALALVFCGEGGSRWTVPSRVNFSRRSRAPSR